MKQKIRWADGKEMHALRRSNTLIAKSKDNTTRGLRQGVLRMRKKNKRSIRDV